MGHLIMQKFCSYIQVLFNLGFNTFIVQILIKSKLGMDMCIYYDKIIFNCTHP